MKSYVKSVVVLSLLTTIGACSSNCYTCMEINSGHTEEYCEDSSLIYTDVNGNAVSFEGSIESLEQNGWTCE